MAERCQHFSIRGAIGRGKVARQCKRPATCRDVKRGTPYCAQHGWDRVVEPIEKK